MNTDKSTSLSNYSLPAEIRVFEIKQQGQPELRDGKIPGHLSQVGFGEIFRDLRVDDHQAAHANAFS